MARTRSKIRIAADETEVFGYDSYQEYLKEIYQKTSKASDTYSYVQFSIELGLGKTNASHLIINDKRPLTLKLAETIAKSLDLKSTAKKYFLTMVQLKRSKDKQERLNYFEELLGLKRQSLSTEIDRKSLDFYSHWYHAAILEVLRLDLVEHDANAIAKALQGKVTLKKVKDTLTFLQDLKLIQWNETSKRYEHQQTSLKTGDYVKGFAVTTFHREMIDQAINSLINEQGKKRYVSSTTMAVSNETFQKIQEEIIALRHKIVGWAEEDQGKDKVAQLNMQLFHLTESKK